MIQLRSMTHIFSVHIIFLFIFSNYILYHQLFSQRTRYMKCVIISYINISRMFSHLQAIIFSFASSKHYCISILAGIRYFCYHQRMTMKRKRISIWTAAIKFDVKFCQQSISNGQAMINELIICKFGSGRGLRISKFTRFSIFYRRQKSPHSMYMYYMTYPLNFTHCQQARGIYQQSKSTRIVPHCYPRHHQEKTRDCWLFLSSLFFLKLGWTRRGIDA